MNAALQVTCILLLLLAVALAACHLRAQLRQDRSREPFVGTGYSPYDALRDQMEGPRRKAKQDVCRRETAALCGPSFGRPGSDRDCFAHGMAQCMDDLAPRVDG